MTGETFERMQVTIDEDLADLIPGFLENRRKDVNQVRQALKAGDFETVREIGHGMKGVGGGYGFDAITDMGAALESAAINRDDDRVQEQTDRLAAYLDSIDIVYE